MINALDLNCQILALNTVFNLEMLKNKKSVIFDKNSITEKINEFEEIFKELERKNKNYKFPEKYDWNFISKQYLEVFRGLTNCQNK